MASSDDVIAHFRIQSEHCRRLGSPFTAALLDVIAGLLPQRPAWAAALLAWPGDPQADALALRVAGALHRAVLEGADRTSPGPIAPAASMRRRPMRRCCGSRRGWRNI